MQIRRRQVFVRDLLTAWFRQARLEVTVFALILFGTYLGNWLIPSVYESTTTLLVSSTAATDPADSAMVRDDALLLLRDVDFLRGAVDRIGLQTLLEQEQQGARDQIIGLAHGIGEGLQLVPSLGPMDQGAFYLQRQLTAKSGGSDRLIRLAYRATDPGFAQSTLRQLSAAFVDLHYRPASAQFALSPAEELAAAEAKLEALVAEHNPDVLAASVGPLQQRVQELRAQLREQRDATLLTELANLDAEIARTQDLLEDVQRMEDEVLALSASVALSGGERAPALAAGPVSFSVVTPPTLPVLPVEPNRLRNVTYAFWIVLALTPVVGIVAQWFDHTILFPEDLEHRMSVPVLGSSFADEGPGQKAIALQQVCARLRNRPDKQASQVWLITSAREGAGSLPADLADTLAEDSSATVLFMDLHATNGDTPGFGDVVLDRTSLDDAIQPFKGKSNLSQIVRGAAEHPNPLFLAAAQSERHWQALRDRFTDIIVSTPPILIASETLTVANRCDAVLLVVQAERVRREVVARACEILANAQANVGGAFLTDRRTHIPRWLYTRI